MIIRAMATNRFDIFAFRTVMSELLTVVTTLYMKMIKNIYFDSGNVSSLHGLRTLCYDFPTIGPLQY